MSGNDEAHWERIFREKPSETVSWYQAYPDLSLQLIEQCGLDVAAVIIDVGGGASLLVDHLLRLGYSNLPVERYDVEKMGRTLGADFTLLENRVEHHIPPSGAMQSFTYALFCYRPGKG